MHRNLFFRTASLLKSGIDPVYVLEGQAPELKACVMKKRQENRYGPSQSTQTNSVKTKDSAATSRSRYKHVQKECKELLDALGVTTIESKGEAEAACAGLDQQGAVDGCITVDGDSFLYGAKTVYRNLSTDTSHFVCQEYSMDQIESRLNLSRDKLIVLAVLLGCDYLPDGIPGVGKDSALRVVSAWKNGQALKIVSSWLSESEAMFEIPARPPHCSQCKHPGSLRAHAKTGCSLCHLSSGCEASDRACSCEWHRNEIRFEEQSIRMKLQRMTEVNVKAIFDEFANEVHMQQRGSPIPKWKMPSVQDFVQIATKKLKWETSYAVEKVLPLIGRWVVIHGSTTSKSEELPITPLRIRPKKRVKRGCPFYEVEWKFKQEIPDFPLEFQTLEPQFLVEREFNHLLPQPVQKPLKKPGRTKKKGKPTPVEDVPVEQRLEVMLNKMCIEGSNTRSAPCSSDISVLDLTAGNDDSDLSLIVDMICQRKRTDKPPSKLPLEQLSIDVQTRNVNPLPNFSLNFSVGNLLNSSDLSTSTLNKETGSVSTPLKKFPGSDLREEANDSFSTPPPLAERFSRLRL